MSRLPNFVATTLVVGLSLLVGSAAQAQVAVRGATVHTLAGPPIENGVVVVENGRITAVGPASSVSIPEGLEVLEAEVVAPGLIDAHSVLGLSGMYNSNVGPVRDQDQLETSDPMQPELRAIDAYDPREPLIEWARSFGVTTLHTGHGPGALISGQTMIAKTRGDTVEEATVEPLVMIAVTLDDSVHRNFKTPGTSAKRVSMLREALVGAQQYRDRRDRDGEAEEGKGGEPPPRDLEKEVLAAVLDGEVAMMVTAHSAEDIASALRLQREFDFDLVLDGAAEGYLLIDEIRAAGVPVILHPSMARLRNGSYETAARLRDAGIPFALQTGFEGYVPKTRVLVMEAAIYAAHGLGFDDALAAVTREPARLLGIDERVGTLETGKDGDLVLFTGDPFEYTSRVCGVVIEGEVVSRDCH